MALIRDLVDAARREVIDRELRGFERQRAQRELEAKMRRAVMRACLRLRSRGETQTDIAEVLDMRRTTLAAWRERWHKNELQAKPRGRPVQRLPTKTLHEIQAQLELHGPSVGVATLRQIFPGLPRRELKDQLRRYRKTYRKENRALQHSLRWKLPGTVWAMDFSEPDQPLEGPFTQLLVVRDLSSNKRLNFTSCG